MTSFPDENNTIMNELLQQLTEVNGVSGNEKEVRLLIRDLIDDYVDEWKVDAMGNLLATKRGTGDTPGCVLVDAHMDEVGLIITHIDNQGMLRFAPVGGFDPRALLGKVVEVGPRKVTGVIGAKAVHLHKPGEYFRIVKTDSMRIDIGAKDKKSASAKVSIGNTAAFVTKYEELSGGHVAIGKAFDNRAGCAALVELLRANAYSFDLVAAFSVQEEIGLRGAGVAAYATKPDAAFVLECTPALDLPTEEDVSPNVSLGEGVSIYVMDARTIQDPRLVAHITRTAEAMGIPFQIRQPGGGGTNTGAIQRIHGGIPSATLAVPGRSAHTPVSMISLDDYRHMVKLAEATLRNLNLELVTHRGDPR